MKLLLKPIISLLDDSSIDVESEPKFIIMKENIKDIVRGIAITSCNVVNIHPGDLFTDENVNILISELKRQVNEWVSSKTFNPLTIEIKGYYDEYGRSINYDPIYYIEFNIKMKAPYLEEGFISDELEYAQEMWNCFKEDKDLEWAYKQKNFVHGLEEYRNEHTRIQQSTNYRHIQTEGV